MHIAEMNWAIKRCQSFKVGRAPFLAVLEAGSNSSAAPFMQ